MVLIYDTTESVYITDFIDKGLSNSTNLSYNLKYCKVDGIKKEIPSENLFLYKYRSLLLSVTEELLLTDDDLVKYKYRPKLFSLDLYGTVEYWYLILIINNITSCSRFTIKKIKYIPPEKMEIIDLILNKERENIDRNLHTAQEVVNV